MRGETWSDEISDRARRRLVNAHQVVHDELPDLFMNPGEMLWGGRIGMWHQANGPDYQRDSV